MDATVDSIFAAAATLSVNEQRDIANPLWDRVEAASTDELGDEMKATLDRRREEIESGKVKCEDAFVVLERLRKKYDV